MRVQLNGQQFTLRNATVVFATITSCTNASNPGVLLAAGLLALNAVRKGLKTRPWVKTFLAFGSKVVTEYVNAAGVTLARIDTPEEMPYYRNGGILPYVLRSLVGRKG